MVALHLNSYYKTASKRATVVSFDKIIKFVEFWISLWNVDAARASILEN